MDGLSFPSVRILIHDSDHWSSLGGNDTSTSDNRYVEDLMIVDTTSNVIMSTGLEDDAYLISSDTTIGASINKRSGFARSVSRNGVANVVGCVYQSVLLAVGNDKVCVI
jgi:hypothetical protein